MWEIQQNLDSVKSKYWQKEFNQVDLIRGQHTLCVSANKNELFLLLYSGDQQGPKGWLLSGIKVLQLTNHSLDTCNFLSEPNCLHTLLREISINSTIFGDDLLLHLANWNNVPIKLTSSSIVSQLDYCKLLLILYRFFSPSPMITDTDQKWNCDQNWFATRQQLIKWHLSFKTIDSQRLMQKKNQTKFQEEPRMFSKE